MADPTWLPEVLKAAGLQCDIYPGAMDRGHGDFGAIWGVVIHHTGASGAPGPGVIANHPTLGLCSQLHLDRKGKYTLCGVGIAWHAGNGAWPGIPTNDANRLTIGIEAENNGTEGWSKEQYHAYVVGVAAILKKLGHNSERVIGHKEWAGPSQGKWDPGSMDMNVFRKDVQKVLETWAAPKPVEPPKPSDKPLPAGHFKSRVPNSTYTGTLEDYILNTDARVYAISKHLGLEK
jgi:hypothetical protein